MPTDEPTREELAQHAKGDEFGHCDCSTEGVGYSIDGIDPDCIHGLARYALRLLDYNKAFREEARNLYTEIDERLRKQRDRYQAALVQVGNDPISFDERHGTNDDTRWRFCQELARKAIAAAERGEDFEK